MKKLLRKIVRAYEKYHVRAFAMLVAVSAGVVIGIVGERMNTTTVQAEVPKETHQCPEAEIVPVYIEVPVYVEPEAVYYDVPLTKELQDHIFAECEKHGIDPAIVIAMCYRESSYNASAVGDNGRSFGLMQIQKRYHEERMERLGVTDLLDPKQNVTVGIDFLAELLDRYNGDVAKALVAYNRGHYAGEITQYALNVVETAEGLMTNDTHE
jgi:hypothetical protein